MITLNHSLDINLAAMPGQAAESADERQFPALQVALASIGFVALAWAAMWWAAT